MIKEILTPLALLAVAVGYKAARDRLRRRWRERPEHKGAPAVNDEIQFNLTAAFSTDNQPHQVRLKPGDAINVLHESNLSGRGGTTRGKLITAIRLRYIAPGQFSVEEGEAPR